MTTLEVAMKWLKVLFKTKMIQLQNNKAKAESRKVNRQKMAL